MKPRSRYKKQNYQPINPKKYIGKYPIVCRSSWEIKMAEYLDRNTHVLKWASEPFSIPYRMPGGEVHRYFPDYYVELKTSLKVRKLVIEVKPIRETKKPRKSREKKPTTKLYEEQTYIKNQCKWEYAKVFCKKRGYEFVIFTEKEIFPNKYKAKQGGKKPYTRKKKKK